MSGQCVLEAGGHWHGYEVEGPAPGGRAGQFEATNISSMEVVVISASPLTKDTDRRREAWQKLAAQIPVEARILPCREVIEEDGWRYEVTNRPPAMALREWVACNKADSWTKKHLLQQLLVAVNALHAQGLVHLNIRPDSIYIDEGEGEGRMKMLLGGLENVMLHNLPRLEAEVADPFYAPPESVDAGGGLASGIRLRAWDWWGVGRVMQELELGRHVMSMLFDGDVIRQPSALLRDRAVALLQEREPAGVRAGAVEIMEGLDAATTDLLHGLLTSARDARWGADAVQRWLAKEDVSDHYDLARDARFFNWQGRGLTLPEAVSYFSTEQHWAAGEQNIGEPDNPETLAHFLSTVPEHAADWEKIRDLHARLETIEWGRVPPAARRTIETTAAWLVLKPKPDGLVIKGRPLDVIGLAELLGRGEDSGHLELVLALASAPGLALLQPLDPAAAPVLARLAETGLGALRQAELNRWINPESADDQARVLRLALEPEAAIKTRADRMRTVFATSRDPALAALLADQSPPPWVDVLLVLTGEDPHRFGYVTRAAYNRDLLVVVDARCRQLQAVVFWRRLRRLLLAGGSCTGERSAFVVLAAGLTALGLVVARDAATTLGLLFGIVGLRLLLAWRVRELAGRFAGGGPPWGWSDGPARCAATLQRLWPEGRAVTGGELTALLAAAEAESAGLRTESAPRPPVLLPRLVECWAGLAVCACLCVAGTVQLTRSYGSLVGETTEAGFAEARRDRSGDATRPSPITSSPAQPAELPIERLSKIPGMTPALLVKLRRGEYEIVSGDMGDTLHGPLKKWDLPPPAAPAPLPVRAQATATAAQRAFVRVSGELLVAPYARNSVNALLGVPVPVAGGTGMMLYNIRERRLVDGVLLLLGGQLADRTWYKLDRRKIVYLGEPASLQGENSLALQ